MQGFWQTTAILFPFYPLPFAFIKSALQKELLFLPDLPLAAGLAVGGCQWEEQGGSSMQGSDVELFATPNPPFTMQCFHIHVFSAKPGGGIFLRHPKVPSPNHNLSKVQGTGKAHACSWGASRLNCCSPCYSTHLALPVTAPGGRSGSFSPPRHVKAHKKASPLWRRAPVGALQQYLHPCPRRSLAPSQPTRSLQAPHPGEM